MRILILLLPIFMLGARAPHAFEEALPKFYQSFDRPTQVEQELGYLIVEVNGESRLVKGGQTLNFVRGDQLRIQRAALKRPGGTVEVVNLVGFRNPSRAQLLDDRGEVIDTSRFLHTEQWTVDKAGRTFAVAVTSKHLLHGLVFLQRIEPELLYADITVNDKVQVMREGETLQVRASDLFKVKQVVTNLKDHQAVRFQIVPRQEAAKKAVPGQEAYEILFSHHAYVFARIPVVVVEKL